MPTVSVGMPVYNGEEFICEAIESVLAQSFADLELVISDNASTDRSQEICKDYASRDKRIKYIRNSRNIGASDNYNAVYLKSSGKYFKWASCNDLIDPDFLKNCVNILERYPDVVIAFPKTKLFQTSIQDAEIVYDDLHLTDESPCRRYEKFLERVRLNNVMNGVIRREALADTDLIKPYYSSDTVLMAELALRGKFYEVPNSYFYRRMDEKTATHLKSAEEVVKHYDPEMKNLMLFQTFKLQYAYLKGIKRTPLRLREKKCLYRYYFKQLRWSRNKLANDLREMLQKYYHKLTTHNSK